MKILVKRTGKRKRILVEVTPNTLISDLKKTITPKFNLESIKFRLFGVICGSFKILLTDSYTVGFFNFSHNDYIEIDAYGYKVLVLHRKCRYSTYLDIFNKPVRHFSENSILDGIIKICIEGDYESLCNFLETNDTSSPADNILNQSDSNLWTPLHYACYYGNTTIVKCLVEKHVNVNKVTIDQWTALQLSCYKGQTQCVLILIQLKNLQINKMTRYRGTSLHLSCERNYIDIVKLLLSKDAYVALKDPNGLTPFDLTTDRDILNLLAVSTGQQVLREFEEFELTPFAGKVWLTGIFFIHDRLVILELDTDKGCLNRYGSWEKFQDGVQPELSIKLTDIQDIREDESWIFSNKDEYYFVVETSKFSHKYYTKHQPHTLEWIQRLQKANNYYLVKYHETTNSNSNEDTINQVDLVEDKTNIVENAPVNTGDLNCKDFNLLEEIGSGSFGTVYKVEKKATGETFAMKSLSKSKLKKLYQLKYAISECKIMQKLKHPFILTLYHGFQDEKYLYMILDYCSNGDLSGIIRSQKTLDEKSAKFYLGEIILALEYLHSLKILYRDLKPANILLNSDGHIKLADFGLAKENVGLNNPAMSMAGTPAYLPPETVNRKGTTTAADIYGLGLLLYEMLTGRPLFTGNDLMAIYNHIKKAKITFPTYVSEPARDLINLVTSKNPEKRPTIPQIKRHPFFRRTNWQALYEKRIKPPDIKNIDIANLEETDYC
jgi:tRNA A-37 threonylcarbamoyl transferase component Bud32